MSIKVQPKSDHQKLLESGKGSSGLKPWTRKVKVWQESDRSPAKIGEILNVTTWGSFGAYDEYNRWIDFWSCKEI